MRFKQIKQSWRLAGFSLVLLEGCYMGSTDLGHDGFLGGRSGTHGKPDGGRTAGTTNGGSPGSGGQAAGTTNGGSPGNGGQATCYSGTACGGDVVGSWAAASSCLEVTGALDISNVGFGCSFASITASLEVSGTWTAYADGTYEDLTTTSGEGEIVLAAECLNISGTTVRCERLGSPLESVGYGSVTCEDAAHGGCTCLAHFEQTAGLGVLSAFPLTSGTYTLSNGILTTRTSEAPSGTAYRYCVSGDTLTMTPETITPSTVGNIVFQKL
jgi:hypothetical protein